jgi:hypothetical protein
MPGIRSGNDAAASLASTTVARRRLLAATAAGAGALVLDPLAPAHARRTEAAPHAFTVRQPGYEGDREWIHLRLDPDGDHAPVPLTVEGTGTAESTLTVTTATGRVTVGDRTESAGERTVELAAVDGGATVWVTPRDAGEPGEPADTIVIESGGERREIAVWNEVEEGRWGGPRNEGSTMELGIVAVHAALLRVGERSEVIMYSPPRELDPYSGKPAPNPRFPGQYVWDKFQMDGMEIRALRLPDFAVVDRKMHPPVNLFCGGQAQTPRGRLLHAGGHISLNPQHHNADSIYTYDPLESDSVLAWDAVDHTMAKARWYPTVTALPDGRMLVASGAIQLPLQNEHDLEDDGFFSTINNDYIIVDPATGEVQQTTADGRPLELVDQARIDAVNEQIRHEHPLLDETEVRSLLQQLATYPGVFVLPGAAPEQAVVAMAESNRTWLYTYRGGVLHREDAVFAMISEGSRSYPHYGSMVLLPLEEGTAPRILAVGGQHETRGVHRNLTDSETDNPATDTAEIFEVDTEAMTGEWIGGGRMRHPRVLCDATLLADGQVLVSGGSTWGWGDANGGPVHDAELFDPAADAPAFRRAATATVERRYHSTALLLPDGSMLKAGSTGGFGSHVDDTEARMHVQTTGEIYYPGYLFRGPRPIIHGVTGETAEDDGASAHGEFLEATVAGLAVNDKARLALIRPGATTHGNNTNQRFVWLRSEVEQEMDGSWRITAAIPESAGMVPPGDYMLVVVADGGIPSEAAWIRVAVPPTV